MTSTRRSRLCSVREQWPWQSIPAFTVHGIGAGGRVFKKGSISHDAGIRVESLINELYAELSNATFFRPEPGRTVRVSDRMGF